MPIQSNLGPRRTNRFMTHTAGLIAFSLFLAATPGPLQAQTTLINPVTRQELPDTTATLAEKISRAHQEAMKHAQALADYVDRNRVELNNSTMREHSDAIGQSLDDALDAAAKLASKFTDQAAKSQMRLIIKHDSRAKETYRTLLGMLRGSSITVPEIKMRAIQIHQDVSAAEQELARITIPVRATTLAQNR